jgi:alginate O-acetyltransferase complex protein AlgI
MLFYEPLFLTVFAAFYAFYLLVTGAPLRKWLLLIASTLFYLWGEPVFVAVLLVSTAFDYALSFYLGEATPRKHPAAGAHLGDNRQSRDSRRLQIRRFPGR